MRRLPTSRSRPCRGFEAFSSDGQRQTERVAQLPTLDESEPTLARTRRASKTNSGECRLAVGPHMRTDGRIVSDVATYSALYDVVTDKMVQGPQVAFKSLAGAVKATAGAPSLKTFPVEAGTARSGQEARGRTRLWAATAGARPASVTAQPSLRVARPQPRRLGRTPSRRGSRPRPSRRPPRRAGRCPCRAPPGVRWRAAA
jgi:hypothetical protein